MVKREGQFTAGTRPFPCINENENLVYSGCICNTFRAFSDILSLKLDISFKLFLELKDKNYGGLGIIRWLVGTG